MAEPCTHLDQIQEFSSESDGCEECLELGDTWVHLRQCVVCGHVGCCDNSKNRHATKHFQATSHPIIRSIERGEHWLWCYVDQVTMETAP
ncbi:MAG: UBP-type zinc finger domain-containing protein [Chloroflexia bacterium]|nr:UBP-type zinc finger domain-containing protein [Chloroflexia bacterium]